VAWQTIKARTSGYVALNELLQPNEQAIAYGLTYLYSPEERQVTLLLGSDDGVKLWVNDVWYIPIRPIVELTQTRIESALI
jgi:hypothetical protein